MLKSHESAGASANKKGHASPPGAQTYLNGLPRRRAACCHRGDTRTPSRYKDFLNLSGQGCASSAALAFLASPIQTTGVSLLSLCICSSRH